MALDVYRKKRKFGVTAEPRGGKIKRGGHAFVIQKHDATRLHYDLRLELDGVMKSWAVTRGPSLVPGEKRLAVQVEDHPVEYNTFEGTIPKGEYGGGTVLIWDRGTWEPENEPHKGLAKGHLDFRLEGNKLSGLWHLVRMRRRPGEKRENWLLIKSEDEAARRASDPDILEEKPKSVVSGRTLEAIAKAEGDAVWHSNRSIADNVTGIKKAAKKTAKPAKKTTAKKSGKTAGKTARSTSRAQLAASEVLHGKPGRRSALPDFVPPELAILQDRPPESRNYVHEAKFDGYRIQARLQNGKVKLLTRKALDWTEKFSPVADAVAKLGAENAIIDGEIVVLNANGLSDFSALQEELKHGKTNFVYYMFDLMHLDGASLLEAPLLERKAALARLLGQNDRNGTLRLSEHFEIPGSQMYQHACELHLEGLISKRRDAPYRSGRSDAWIKSKCGQNQEFVIVGYKDATHLKRAIGALVLGTYEDGKLRYAGRSGTGYSEEVARDLWKRLQPLRRDTPAFGKIPQEERGRKGIWVEPKLVAEVTFAGFTTQNRHVRHAAFKGLREDKSATEVVREEPMPAKARTKAKSATKPTKSKARPAAEASAVKLTHPDRVYWPDAGVTKQQLADYYDSVWDLIAPHLVNRPLALLRCPGGVNAECFFQKHAAAGLVNENIRRMKDSHGEELLSVADRAGLMALVQAGVLEIHVWGSTIEDVEHANRIVFDLDPGDDVKWADVNKAARELRDRLAALKLTSFVKTTGGKGLHVVVPIKPTPWDDTKDFAHAMVLAMEADAPDRYVTKMTKSIRKGRTFLDYLRNGRGATAVVAYSTRARAGAPVSMPVDWDELGPTLKPNKFTVLNVARRLGALKDDPWADIGKVKQALPKLT
ncbi:MAG: DNA ligase D [Alphaproteobacteria bacterium]|nr:DNA ligase D [Alphaproteobacteria bacterium]